MTRTILGYRKHPTMAHMMPTSPWEAYKVMYRARKKDSIRTKYRIPFIERPWAVPAGKRTGIRDRRPHASIKVNNFTGAWKRDVYEHKNFVPFHKTDKAFTYAYARRD